MTHPRMSIPGATYMVTRSTTMSLFLLVPGPVVNQALEYSLAWAAQGRGILLHAFSFESNHYHLVVTDLEGQLSEFMQEFNRCAARCLLEYYRHRFPNTRLDAVWSPGQSFSQQVLPGPAAMYDEIAYTLTNPVKDGLVRDYRRWPGLNCSPDDWRGRERTVKRPTFFFRNTPQELTYRVVPPVQLGDELEQVIAAAEHHIEEAQATAHQNLADEGRRFMSRTAIMAVDPFSSPDTPPPKGDINPVVAAGGDAQARAAALRAIKLFRATYREAWRLFRRGLYAIFPGGTLLLRKRFRVECTDLDVCWCQLAVP
ncbi:MAG: hypothetical protein KC543_17535 [Myxococcales bacterium]|nr:hypothetical protein [Myxococcales bacterium]